MITGVAIVAVSAGGAFAQAAPAPAEAAPIQELVVTGSRIPSPNLTSIAPVASVNSQEVRLTGTTRIEDLINSLPQAYGDQTAGVSNGSTGTADANLRNLGPSRTLVLIDGRRLVPGDPGFPYADLNFIPSALVDRVEVDTAGASSVYGSDAVAGVVNFIMKRNFEGIRLDLNYGGYQNNNGNTLAQAANKAKGYPFPSGASGIGGTTVEATVIIGANSPDGKGNVEGYVTYHHQNKLFQGTRDYSNCQTQVNATNNGFKCFGSSAVPDGRFLIRNAGPPIGSGSTVYDKTLDAANPGNFRDRTGADVFNFAPVNYFLRPDERYEGGFFAHYDVSPAIQAYSEFMFSDDHTLAQIAPTVIGSTFTIACNNPFLTGNEMAAICNTGPDGEQQFGGPGQPAANPGVFVLKRGSQFGNRIDDLRHTDYRAVIGLKGDLGGAWHYDVYGQYGAAVYSENYLNDVSTSNFAKAVNVVPDPVTGAPVCAAAAADPACVPFDLFHPNLVTPAAIAYVQKPGFKEGQTTEQVVSGSLIGNLGQYGAKSPWAHDGVGVAVGAEYRRETLRLRVDNEFLTGDLAGQGAATPNQTGAFDVKEVFGELRVPIIQDMPFVKSLKFEGGYRFSHYSLSGDTNTYKFSGDWAITDDIRIRGGYNRAVRAPNILELFGPQHLQLDGSSDGCTGATPVFTLAQCINTGLAPVKYGNLPGNPAQQYNGITGGNPNLTPEISDTYSLGVVLTPHALLNGFTFSADYFDIKVRNVIQSFGADNILDTCATTGNPTFCNLVHRAPGSGSLWLGNNGFIVDTIQNLGSLKTSGIDFAADYHTRFQDLGLGDFGGIALAFAGTYTHDYIVQDGPGQPLISCVGKFGKVCQGSSTPLTGPVPSFRSRTRLTWTTPWYGVGVSVNWRYTGPVAEENGATTFDSKIGAQNYFDVAATMRLKDRYNFRIGVKNVLDRDPPIFRSDQVPQIGPINGNTFPGIYDALGRFLFVGVTADF